MQVPSRHRKRGEAYVTICSQFPAGQDSSMDENCADLMS